VRGGRILQVTAQTVTRQSLACRDMSGGL